MHHRIRNNILIISYQCNQLLGRTGGQMDNNFQTPSEFRCWELFSFQIYFILIVLYHIDYGINY